MAVDTRNRRFSMMGIASPYRQVLPNPDGTTDAPDRLQRTYRYAGLAASIVVVTTFSTYYFEMGGPIGCIFEMN